MESSHSAATVPSQPQQQQQQPGDRASPDAAGGDEALGSPLSADSSRDSGAEPNDEHEHEGALSVDSDESDANSSLGDIDRASSSVSASSSVYDFVEEFGRTYHRYTRGSSKEGKYYLPNDEQEQNRLDLQHALASRVLNGKLYLAPIGDNIHRALDIGTGTGIWAIEFAEQHPEADVLGTDFSPIQPEYVPPNCRFEIDDLEDEWVYSHQFDYIHGRYIVGFLSDVPRLVRNIYDNLKPGAYVEFMETLMTMDAIDDSLKGTALEQWQTLMVEGVRKTGKDPLACVHLKKWLAEAGFRDVQEKKYAVPANPWARGEEQKIRGSLMMTNLLEVAQGITMQVCTKVHGWTREAVELFLVDVRAELKDRRRHGYVPMGKESPAGEANDDRSLAHSDALLKNQLSQKLLLDLCSLPHTKRTGTSQGGSRPSPTTKEKQAMSANDYYGGAGGGYPPQQQAYGQQQNYGGGGGPYQQGAGHQQQGYQSQHQGGGYQQGYNSNPSPQGYGYSNEQSSYAQHQQPPPAQAYTSPAPQGGPYGQPPPPQQTYGHDGRGTSPYPPPQHQQQQGYGSGGYPQGGGGQSQYQAGPGGPQQQDDRGLGATLIGGGAAGWAAHAAGGGALGTMAGAVAGAVGANFIEHKLEGKNKKHKKDKKEKKDKDKKHKDKHDKHHKRRGSGSSSSSSSSSD